MCADPSLYRRFLAAGFAPVTWGLASPSTDPKTASEWRAYYEGISVGVLSEAEAAEWRAAAADASAEGSFLWAFGYHCAVGTKL